MSIPRSQGSASCRFTWMITAGRIDSLFSISVSVHQIVTLATHFHLVPKELPLHDTIRLHGLMLSKAREYVLMVRCLLKHKKKLPFLLPFPGMLLGRLRGLKSVSLGFFLCTGITAVKRRFYSFCGYHLD
jgi:hypothetical protein